VEVVLVANNKKPAYAKFTPKEVLLKTREEKVKYNLGYDILKSKLRVINI